MCTYDCSRGPSKICTINIRWKHHIQITTSRILKYALLFLLFLLIHTLWFFCKIVFSACVRIIYVKHEKFSVLYYINCLHDNSTEVGIFSNETYQIIFSAMVFLGKSSNHVSILKFRSVNFSESIISAKRKLLSYRTTKSKSVSFSAH